MKSIILEDTIELFQFNLLSEFSNLTHGISTRRTVSGDNFNISANNVLNNGMSNRHILAKSLNTDVNNLIFCNQIHSGESFFITNHEEEKPSADAIITNIPKLTLCVMVADCTPILLFDKKNNSIASIHAGRAGTMQKIVINTINNMINKLGSNPNNIIACIGPCISVTNYPISPEAEKSVLYSLGRESISYINKKAHFDLKHENTTQLLDIGVRKENIEVANICTYENNNLFFSERHDGKPTGRFCSFISLN